MRKFDRLSPRELHERFPSVTWGEESWAVALTCKPTMMDTLADKFAAMAAVHPIPRPRRG